MPPRRWDRSKSYRVGAISPSGPPEIEEARAGAQSRAEPRKRALHGGGWCLGARVVGGAVFARAAIDDDACLLHADHTLRRLDGVGHVADPVDQLEVEGLLGRVDPAVGDLPRRLEAEPPALGELLDELTVEAVDDRLEDL